MKKKHIFRTRVLLIFLFMFASLFLGMDRCSAQEAGEAEILEDSLAQPPAPPTDVVARDAPNDNGHALLITWTLSADDGAGLNNVVSYQILRSDSPEGEFEVRGLVPAGESIFEDKGAKEKEDANYFPSHKNFYYKVRARSDGLFSDSEVSLPAHAYGQWYHTGKTPVLLAVLIFSTFALVFITIA
ncbi:MAG: hypothetical protein KAW16_08855, partial [candidate division Zixibacteria bacterium]|nr:hypothetical protein [candidate division Zixibacteria bacterium]